MSARVETVCVLGAGSWGATLAALLADKGYSVALWDYDEQDAAHLRSKRRLPVLRDLKLPRSLTIDSRIDACVFGKSIIVCAVPSHAVRETMRRVRESNTLDSAAIIVSATKGLEEETHKRMTEVISEELDAAADRLIVLSGPSHAEEVCRKLPTMIVASGASAPARERVRTLFNTDYLRVYGHGDPLGVELAGALKNVYAIACGVSDGLGFGDNTRAAIMARGLNEMTRIGTKLGAQLLTFFGLAGMGDLAVTCMSRHSRNHRLGEKIGKGQSAKAALASISTVAEGYRTASSAQALAERLKLDCPLTREIYDVLYRQKEPRASLQQLMMRAPLDDEWRELHP